jgi:hypothetical protein
MDRLRVAKIVALLSLGAVLGWYGIVGLLEHHNPGTSKFSPARSEFLVNLALVVGAGVCGIQAL